MAQADTNQTVKLWIEARDFYDNIFSEMRVDIASHCPTIWGSWLKRRFLLRVIFFADKNFLSILR